MIATIITVAVPAILGLFGTVLHSNHSGVKEKCIDNYSKCITNKGTECDKIKEICKGYLK